MAAPPVDTEPQAALVQPDGFTKVPDSVSPGAVPHGNFRHYYTFNEPEERTKHLPPQLLLKCVQQRADDGSPLLMLDIGCNTGVGATMVAVWLL